MAKDDSVRKRRRVDAAGTSRTTEETTGAVVFDDEAMKRHMLSLMQQPVNGTAQHTDSEDDGEEEQESDESDDGSEDGSAGSVVEEADSDSEEQGDRGKQVEADLNSDDEDQDETARALLQGRGTTKSEPEEEAASRISRIPTNRNTTAAPKKPILKTTFEGLGLSPQLIRTLAGISIRKPTEIQSACFEHILNGKSFKKLLQGALTQLWTSPGRDCIGGAKTGSGKTMAFALPILQRIAKDPFGIFAVVLTPTRYVRFQVF